MSQVHTWFAVLGERFKTPLPPAVLRSVGVPACKGAMAEPNLDSASWDQPPAAGRAAGGRRLEVIFIGAGLGIFWEVNLMNPRFLSNNSEIGFHSMVKLEEF
jgi:hypothetical protein